MDNIDKITLDVPLFIRLLEYAKEDAKTDMDLHSVTENIIKLSKNNECLLMKNYNNIVSIRKTEAKEQTMSDSSGAFETSLSSPIKREIKKLPNFITKKELQETIESSGEYDVAAFAGKGRSKDPLRIDGIKSVNQSSAVKGRIPKLVKGSTYVKINDKCKKFPYCNQGDPKAVQNITESNEKLYNKLSGIASKLNPYLEKFPKITNKGLLESMRMIGDGNLEAISYSETIKYSEKLNDDLELVVYGNIGTPVMTRCYEYEIIVFRGPSFTTQFGGGFGSPGIITKNRNRLFVYSTGQLACHNESTISELCNVVRNYFTQDN